MGNNHVVILDYSHTFHRCFAIALSRLSHYDLVDSIAYHVQGTLRTLDRALQKLNISSYDLVFAEDRVPFRKLNLLPSYRSNRTSNHDAKKQAVKARLKERGVQGHWCYSEGNEADDVIASIIKMTKSRGLFSIIVTGDRDLWQLMGQTVVVFDPKKKDLITNQDVEEAFAVPSSSIRIPPTHIALYKTVWGDAGDCVPNACPRTQKHLLPIMRRSNGTYGDFSILVESEWDNLPVKCKEKLIEGAPQLEINWQLVCLDSDCTLNWE